MGKKKKEEYKVKKNTLFSRRMEIGEDSIPMVGNTSQKRMGRIFLVSPSSVTNYRKEYLIWVKAGKPEIHEDGRIDLETEKINYGSTPEEDYTHNGALKDIDEVHPPSELSTMKDKAMDIEHYPVEDVEPSQMQIQLQRRTNELLEQNNVWQEKIYSKLLNVEDTLGKIRKKIALASVTQMG